MIWLAISSLVLAAVPAVLWVLNSISYRPPKNRSDDPDEVPGVSVLIPARNEEERLEPTLRSIRRSKNVDLEIIVYDDNSDDGTPRLVQKHAGEDDRVQLIEGTELPSGWTGKQYACWQLAREAEREILCFVDADVRLSEGTLSRTARRLRNGKSSLLSGFPEQETSSFGEQLLLPFIQYTLLGFLPIYALRHSTWVGFSAGCGQFMMTESEAYKETGGHREIRHSKHDGITLPAAFRRAGLYTDLVDLTDLASVRMYTGFVETWIGLAKNASEGMARPLAIPFFTLFLLGGQILPPMLLLGGFIFGASPGVRNLSAAATMISYLPRIAGVFQFRQPVLSALLHPVGVAVLLANQWFAFFRDAFGGTTSWRGRTYSSDIHER